MYFIARENIKCTIQDFSKKDLNSNETTLFNNYVNIYIKVGRLSTIDVNRPAQSMKIYAYLDKDMTNLYAYQIIKPTHITIPNNNEYLVSVSLSDILKTKTNMFLEKYYLYVEGVTNYGLHFHSPVYPIAVDYRLNEHTIFQAEAEDGHVNLSIQDDNIYGYVEPGNESYTIKDGYLDLPDGESLFFDVNIPYDFNMTAHLLTPFTIDEKTPIIEFWGDNEEFHGIIFIEFSNYDVREEAPKVNVGEHLPNAAARLTMFLNDRTQMIKFSNHLTFYSNDLTKVNNKTALYTKSPVHCFIVQIRRESGYWTIQWEDHGEYKKV